MYYVELISSKSYIQSQNDFQNLQVNRTIDLRNHIVKITSKVLIKNLKIDPINSYRFPLLKNQTKSLLSLEAKMSTLEDEDQSFALKIHKQQKTNDDFLLYDLTFRSEPMNHEEERLLIITEYYSDQYVLLPKKIALQEDQYVVFSQTQNFISYYETLNQKTKVKLPVNKNKVLGYTKSFADGFNTLEENDKIIYTCRDPIEPFYYKIFKAHYECNFSLVVFNYVEKFHEVSHWGNIAVEEKYQIENIGAKLDGEFGRIDFDEDGVKGGKNALRALFTKLPLRANNLWYRDEIGNVSSSRAMRDWDDVKLDIEPRFPLLGGWKNNYMTGYSLPTKFHVRVGDDGYNRLNLTFGLGYEDILAKNYTFKVILPEHSEVSKVNLPIDGNFKISYEKTFSFLDIFGRTTVVITMNNVFDIHKIPFEVKF